MKITFPRVLSCLCPVQCLLQYYLCDLYVVICDLRTSTAQLSRLRSGVIRRLRPMVPILEIMLGVRSFTTRKTSTNV